MTRYFLTIFYLTLINNCITTAQNGTQNNIHYGNLIVVITGLDNNEGTVHIALVNSRYFFESEDTTFQGVIVNINNFIAEYIFERIPFGEYAVKAYHDENSNNELDTNFLGIPDEDYGFSNNARGLFGPADYDDAKFNFDKDGMIITIKLE